MLLDVAARYMMQIPASFFLGGHELSLPDYIVKMMNWNG
jgi:hypothetical protein